MSDIYDIVASIIMWSFFGACFIIGFVVLTAPPIGSGDYVDIGMKDGYTCYNATVYTECSLYCYHVDRVAAYHGCTTTLFIGTLAGHKCDKLYFYSKGYIKGYEKRAQDEEKYNLYGSIASGRENRSIVYIP